MQDRAELKHEGFSDTKKGSPLKENHILYFYRT